MGGKVALFVLGALVAVCFAQKKCCVPDQYESLAGRVFGGVMGSVPQVMQIDGPTAFDYTNRRLAQIMYVSFQGQRYKSQVIADYKEGVEYSFEIESKQCQKTPLKGPMQHCIPDNAVYDGAAYIGDNQLVENAFSFFINDRLYSGNISLAVTVKGCVPIGGNFIGQLNGEPTLETFGYVNYTKGIKNPDMYFTVPDYCPKSFSDGPAARPFARIPF